MQKSMMANKTVVVTGANSGLGFECAKTIAAANEGWHVVIACRDAQKGHNAKAAIIAATGNTDVTMLPLDLASLDAVRKFPALLDKAGLPPLHGLVCNAGIQVIKGMEYTVDGFELQFGVNHLGHFLLTHLLIDKMAMPARIVIVSSGTHDSNKMEGRFNKPTYLGAHKLAYPDGQKKMVGLQRYATSKLCNMFFAYELDRWLQANGKSGITVNAFDPGAVPGTQLTRSFKSPLITRLYEYSTFMAVFGIIYSTVAKSGQAMARLLIDPQLEGVSGKYFRVWDERPSSKESYDLAKAKDLWEGSWELVKGF